MYLLSLPAHTLQSKSQPSAILGDSFRPKFHYMDHCLEAMARHNLNLSTCAGERKHRTTKKYLRKSFGLESKKQSGILLGSLLEHMASASVPRLVQPYCCEGLHLVRNKFIAHASDLQDIVPAAATQIISCKCVTTDAGSVFPGDVICIGPLCQPTQVGQVFMCVGVETHHAPLEPHVCLNVWQPMKDGWVPSETKMLVHSRTVSCVMVCIKHDGLYKIHFPNVTGTI